MGLEFPLCVHDAYQHQQQKLGHSIIYTRAQEMLMHDLIRAHITTIRQKNTRAKNSLVRCGASSDVYACVCKLQFF